MKTNNNKSSARKKLVPAVAMLTASAVMLSTATYAWFTMNKEVEVTGLNMSATTGDAIEISLGSYSDSAYTTTAPGKDDSSWKRSINFGDYYSGVGKLMPASSDTGVNLKVVESTGVENAGASVLPGTKLHTAGTDTNYGMAELRLKSSSESTELTEGYYIDVPMWIRTNSETTVTEGSEKYVYIDGTVTISNGKTGDEELLNAVRVALIPYDVADSSTGFTDGTKYADTTAKINTVSGQPNIIFGLSNTTHTNSGVLKADTGETTYSETAMGAQTVYLASNQLKNRTLDNTSEDGLNDADITPEVITFKLPAASVNDYSGAAFIARIWIEGESTYCIDANANQDWRIDFHFELCDNNLSGEEGAHTHESKMADGTAASGTPSTNPTP